MSSTAQATQSPAVRSRSEKVVNFVPETVAAPFFLRCAALFADYMVLVVVPVIGIFWNKLFGDGIGYSAPGTGSVTLMLILWVVDFLLLPLLRGQTVGKMLTGLTIVNSDGTPIGLVTILRRNLLGYVLTAATLGLGFLSSIFSSRGRALHDLVAGTIVIRGRRTQL
jgi:uncharacterized RDD family membrane protein YckC